MAAAAASAKPLITIRVEDMIQLSMSTSCLQSSPCQHGVAIVVKGKSDPIQLGTVSGAELVRLMTVFKGKKEGFKISHFAYLMNGGWATKIQNQHMDKEAIVRGNVTIVYPEKYKPKPIEIKVPKPRVPKPSKGWTLLQSYGIHWCGPVTVPEAKSILLQIRGIRV